MQPPSRRRAVPARGFGWALLLTLLAAATADAAPRRAVTLVSVGRPPASVHAGAKIALAAKVRNRTSRTRAASLRALLRGTGVKARGRVIGRKRLRGLRARRSAGFKIAARLPRALRAGRYRVTVCVRARGRRASCRRARGRMRVRPACRPSPAPAGPAPLAPVPKQVQPTPEPQPCRAPELPPCPAPSPSPSPSATPSPSGSPRGVVFQRVEGFGSSARVFDDPHVFDVVGAAPAMTAAQRGEVLDVLYRELGLSRVRPVQPETAEGVGIEPANDNGDPFAMDPAGFDFAGRRLDAHAAHVLGVRARGAPVAWNSPLNRESWMGVSTAADVAEYAEWLLAQVRRFAEQGARLDYVSVANEPSFSRNRMSGEFIRDVIKVLGPRLEAEGLLVPFVIPDDVRASAGAAKAATILADPQARRYVGALATHLYDEPVSNVAAMRDLAQRYGLPLWMSEFSVGAMSREGPPLTPEFEWALLMHELLVGYDVSAIDYLWGFIGAGKTETTLVTLEHTDTAYQGFRRTKVFYYFGQYSRFVRPGALRVSVSSSDPRVRVSAFYRGDERVLVAINPTGSAIATTLSAPDLAGVARLSPTRTSATENWATRAPVPVAGESASVTLPARSVTTLTGTNAP